MTTAENEFAGLELRPIRCTRCGRFLGEERIVVGVVNLKCKNCKAETTILGERGWGLTDQDNDVTVEQ